VRENLKRTPNKGVKESQKFKKNKQSRKNLAYLLHNGSAS